MRNICVAGDHLSETVYFKIPRHFDGKDLSIHSCVIRYFNAGGEYGECDAIDITTETDYISFAWELDCHVTKYSGEIEFTIQFDTVTKKLEYQWQTQSASLNILQGLKGVEKVTIQRNDLIFRSITRRIKDIEMKISDLENIIKDLPDLSANLTTLTDDVKYLQENASYISLDES